MYAKELARVLWVPVRWVQRHARLLGGLKANGKWVFPPGAVDVGVRLIEKRPPRWRQRVYNHCGRCGERGLFEERWRDELFSPAKREVVLAQDHLVCPGE